MLPATGEPELRIRPASLNDAHAIAELSEVLGYPTAFAQTSRRLKSALQRPDHGVGVAEFEDGRVVGWTHVLMRPLLISEREAEIGGLVVHPEYRKKGVGLRLLRFAEGWATARGCDAVMLRSGESRMEAHAFYEVAGYEKIKTSYTFRKRLSS